MSFPKPRKLSNRARVVYPSIIRMEDGQDLRTLPYRKDLHGENFENVKGYLAHVVDEYNTQKKEHIEKIQKLLKEQEALNEPDSE